MQLVIYKTVFQIFIKIIRFRTIEHIKSCSEVTSCHGTLLLVRNFSCLYKHFHILSYYTSLSRRVEGRILHFLFSPFILHLFFPFGLFFTKEFAS